MNSEAGTLNLCLIARRQQLPAQPCTFFWVTDGLALDGVIRSDNRGSESLFPLYAAGTHGAPSANFAPEFLDDIAAAAKLTWQPLSSGALAHEFGPEDLLAYIYALFHAPTYRERYADQLRRDFPRIVAPRNKAQFAAMSRLGRQLIDLHVFRDLQLASAPNPQPPTSNPPPPFDFRVGGYDVLRKWRKPKHRSPADPDYGRIVHAVVETRRLMREIDGWFVEEAYLDE